MTHRLIVRRRWVVGISALVLGAAGIAVRAAGVPESETEPWINAWGSSTSATRVTVWATGQDGPAGWCGTPQVRFAVRETATDIEVTARTTRYIGGIPIINGLPYFGELGCALEAYGQTSAVLELSASVGDRRVVDVATGRARAALDASTAATIEGLPAGLATTDVAADRYSGVRVVRRVWEGRSSGVDQWVDLVTTTDGSLPKLSGGKPATVSGIPLLISGHEGEPRDVHYLQWQLSSGAQANVSVHLAHGVWTRQQVLEIVSRTREPAR